MEDSKMIDSNMIELLTKGMDTVMVPAKYKGSEFQIPACRLNCNDNYRISHATLLYFYRNLKRQYKDVCIQMKSEWNYVSVGYCIAACTVMTKDGESDLYFGENRVTTFSSSADTNNPFQIAVNRAMDKAIYYEIFGLPSRYFSSDGIPVLSGDADEPMAGQEDTQPGIETAAQKGPAPVQEAGTENTKSQQYPAAVTGSAQQGPFPTPSAKGLNSVEEAEYEKLGKIVMKLQQNNGSLKEMTLSEMKDKLLNYVFHNMKPEDDLTAQIGRYIALKEKKMRKTA